MQLFFVKTYPITIRRSYIIIITIAELKTWNKCQKDNEDYQPLWHPGKDRPTTNPFPRKLVHQSLCFPHHLTHNSLFPYHDVKGQLLLLCSSWNMAQREYTVSERMSVGFVSCCYLEKCRKSVTDIHEDSEKLRRRKIEINYLQALKGNSKFLQCRVKSSDWKLLHF